jgi:hypothetical protein
MAARGNEMLQAGNLSAARRLCERAMQSGDAHGATCVGKTYDPVVLRQIGALGMQPDPAQAAKWYRQGVIMGDPGAIGLLVRTQQPQPADRR